MREVVEPECDVVEPEWDVVEPECEEVGLWVVCDDVLEVIAELELEEDPEVVLVV